MKSFFLVESKLGYRYLYSYHKRDLLIIGRVLFEIINKLDLLDTIDENEFLLEVQNNLNCTKHELNYQYLKFKLLKENGYFKPIDPENRFNMVSKRTIEANKNNSISLEMTQKCNLLCSYCTYGELYSHYAKRNNSNLTFENVKLIIDNYLSLDQDVYNIAFYGGEPLLNFELIKRTVEYVKGLNNLSGKIMYSITTNGILLDKCMEFLYENDFNIMVSLDGSEEDNSYRVFADGRPSFKKVVKNLIMFKNKYPEYFKSKIDIGSVIHSKSDLKRINSYLQEEFGKSPILSEVSKIGRRKGKELEFEDIYKKVENNSDVIAELNMFLQKNSKYYFEDYNQLIYQNENTTIIPTGTCLPMAKGIFVTISGQILPCESVPHKYEIGHISNSEFHLNLNEITNNYNLYLEKAKKKCKKCYYARICGQCIFTSFNEKDELNCRNFMENNRFGRYLKKTIELLEQQNSINQVGEEIPN